MLNQDFHIHSNFTDGQQSVEEIAHEVKSKCLKFAVISEHICRNPTYDYQKLSDQIVEVNKKYSLNIKCGIETKILDKNGTLDFPNFPSFIAHFNPIILGAVHSLNGMRPIEAYDGLIKSGCHIIAHPHGMLSSQIKRAKKADKLLELNEAYPLIDNFVRVAVKEEIGFVVGSNAHFSPQIGKYVWVEEIIRKFPKIKIINGCEWWKK